MFNWIVSDTQQYMEPFNFDALWKTELFEIEQFNAWTLCKKKTEV